MGNEAIARGALEAGVKVCAAYPGNPSSEIIGTLAKVAEELGLHVEWSINEKVALEVAAAASFAGLRGLCAMKQNGSMSLLISFSTSISQDVVEALSWSLPMIQQGSHPAMRRIPVSTLSWVICLFWSPPTSRKPKI